MRIAPVLLALPALAVADQIPLFEKAAGWFQQATESAKAYIPSVVPAGPIDAGASVVAASKVEKFNINNYKRKLAPSPEGPEEWMIFVTGKNESCWGGCETANLAWNESIPLLTALPHGPRLGLLDCDKEAVLCASWIAGPPTLWHFSVPQATRGATSQPAGVASGPTRLYITHVNTTTVTPADFVKVQTEKLYLEEDEYKGAFHPIDGWITKAGLTLPMGYVLWFFSATPSWMIMIGISFVSRQIMSKRMGRKMDSRAAVQPPKKDN